MRFADPPVERIRLSWLVLAYSVLSVALSLLLFVLVLSLADTYVQSYGLNRRFYGSASVFVAGVLLVAAVLALPVGFAKSFRRVATLQGRAAATRSVTRLFLGTGAVQCALLGVLATARPLIFLPVIRSSSGITLMQVLDAFLPPLYLLGAVGGGGSALVLLALRVALARRDAESGGETSSG